MIVRHDSEADPERLRKSPNSSTMVKSQNNQEDRREAGGGGQKVQTKPVPHTGNFADSFTVISSC